jgi:DNA-binding beta-propeller fold protein YncE
MKIHILTALILLSVSALAQGTPGEDLVWPAAPERSRIKFMYQVSGAKDIGVQKSWFNKVVDFFFGEEQELDRLLRPQGIAVDAEGRIYVTDIAARGVHIFNLVAKEYTLFTGDEEHRFRSPVGVAVSAAGRLFVSDSERNEILVFDRDRSFVSAFKGVVRRPTGIWLDGDRLYVVDTGENQIVVLSLDGIVLRRIGTRGVGDGEFNFPVAVTTHHASQSPSGCGTFVVDAMNCRVQILDTNGVFLSAFGDVGDGVGRFARPKGIGLDSEGHIYVSDAMFDVIQVFDRDGRILLAFGGSGSAPGRFSLPSAMAFDSKDRLYVVDSGNRRVQVFQYLK